MSDLIFDKLTFVDRLKAGGFTEEQARTQAEALDMALRETVATKADIARLEGRIELLKHELTIRLGGMLVTGIAVVAALVKLL